MKELHCYGGKRHCKCEQGKVWLKSNETYFQLANWEEAQNHTCIMSL